MGLLRRRGWCEPVEQAALRVVLGGKASLKKNWAPEGAGASASKIVARAISAANRAAAVNSPTSDVVVNLLLATREKCPTLQSATQFYFF